MRKPEGFYAGTEKLYVFVYGSVFGTAKGRAVFLSSSCSTEF